MDKKKRWEIADKVASIILAGGEGTRLYPLTKTRCKPDVTFAGRYHLIDIPLSNSLNSKIHNIFILAQHFATQLHDHIFATYPTELFQRGNIELLCPKEKGEKGLFKGTADAVRKNMETLLKSSAEYFLILSGDQLYNMDYSKMIDFAKKKKADLVIAALPVNEAEAKRMGLLKIDASCNVVDFFEKPSDPEILEKFLLPKDVTKEVGEKYLGSMGIYVFRKEALISLLYEDGDDFGKNLIPVQVKKGKTAAYLFDGYWEDIGTIASYYQANLALTSSTQKNWLKSYDSYNPLYTPHHDLSIPLIKNTMIKDSLINQGSVIEAQEIDHCIIGMGAWIKSGTKISDSIIMGDHTFHEEERSHSTIIGENCLIKKAIIDCSVEIGDNVQLINKDNLQKYDADGIHIRDGIIVITSGTKLPSGFVI